MSYRNDVDALAARTEALAAEVATKTQELDAARALLDEAMVKAKLPVLPNIRVASPCPADWNAMTGDERVRACASCNKNVYNLSSLTRDEAEALILTKEGRLCVRYFQRKDGTILLKDCSIGIVQKRKRRVVAVGIAALLGGGVFAAIKLSRPAPTTASAAVELSPSPENILVNIAPELRNEEPVAAPIEEPIDAIEIRGKVALDPELEVVMGGIAPPPELPDLGETPHEGTMGPNGNVFVK